MVSARLGVASEEWVTAQRHLQEILKQNPNHRQAQMLLGSVHKESGNLGQAEMYLSAVVASTPGNDDARRLLAETRLALNRATEAREVLTPIIGDENADPRTLAMAATASTRLGEFDTAVDLLKRGIEQSPDSMALRLQMAYAHFQSGNADEARAIIESLPQDIDLESEFRRDMLAALMAIADGNAESGVASATAIVDRWPDRADAHSVLGFARAMAGNRPGARQSFEEAASLAPQQTGPMWFLAQLDEAEGKLDAAARRYQAIIEQAPDNASALLAMARVAARSEDPEGAIDYLERANEADPGMVPSRQMLALIHMGDGDYAKAEDVISDAVRIDPDNAELHNILGLSQYSQAEYREAGFSFERAISLDASVQRYRLNLARALEKGAGMRAAETSLTQTRDQSMAHLPSGVMLAGLRMEQGDHEGALEISERLKGLHPDEAEPYALEGEIRAKMNDLAGAVRAYDQALAKELLGRYAVRAFQHRNRAELDDDIAPLLAYLDARPLDSDVRMLLAQAYQVKNDRSNSISQYEQVLEADPGNFVAANNLAWAYFREGDARAEQAARLAYRLQPENGSVVDTLGWILSNNGQHGDAVRLLREAVEIADGKPEVRFHLAAALAKAGESSEAKRILRDVLADDDSFSSRIEAEELLRTL